MGGSGAGPVRGEGDDRIDQVDEARGVLLGDLQARVAAEEGVFERVEQVDKAQVMNAKRGLDRVGDDSGECGCGGTRDEDRAGDGEAATPPLLAPSAWARAGPR